MSDSADWSMQGILCGNNQDCAQAGEHGLICCGPPNVPMAPKYCDTPSRCAAVGFQYTPLEQGGGSSTDGATGMSNTMKLGIAAAVVVGAYLLATRS